MIEIPNHMDDPQQILFWEFDELILLSFLFGLGIVVNFLGVLLLAGLVGIKFYRKFKDRQAQGFFFHALYWYAGIGAVETLPSVRPLPFIRRYF
jgi:conjugal transfer pilus assembly protein TraL